MFSFLKNLFGFGAKPEAKVEVAPVAAYKVEAPVTPVAAPVAISPQVEPVVAAKPKRVSKPKVAASAAKPKVVAAKKPKAKKVAK